MKTKLSEKSKLSLGIKVYRAKKGKWEDLGLFWKIKNFFQELRNRVFNLGYADVFTQVGK